LEFVGTVVFTYVSTILSEHQKLKMKRLFWAVKGKFDNRSSPLFFTSLLHLSSSPLFFTSLIVPFLRDHCQPLPLLTVAPAVSRPTHSSNLSIISSKPWAALQSL
jgi:hypothetical protein